MNDRVFAVLMAGGSGTRFWPLSRRRRPKQVLALGEERPMIRVTADRFGDLATPERTLVVTGADQAEAVRRALPDLPAENVLLEPVPRNTAPCLAWAAAVARNRDPDAICLCLPSDHVIEPEEVFRETCRRALGRADAAGTLLTFGVTPDRPATGYGYIREGDETATLVRRVDGFFEKPDLPTAERYLAEGGYRWNSGMFAWRADAFLDEVARHLPDLAVDLPRFTEDFASLPSISVDYGVMEKTDRAEVVAADFSWDDVGSLEALARLLTADADGNCAQGDLLAVESRGVLAAAPDGHLVAALGVEDLIIVTTEDATLVCPRDRAEDVKAIVDELKARGRRELL